MGIHLLFIAALFILSSELIIATKLTFLLIQANYEMFIDANTLYIKNTSIVQWQNCNSPKAPEQTEKCLVFPSDYRNVYKFLATNTLLTLFHGQAFCIITQIPPSRVLPLLATQGCAEQLCEFEPWEPSPTASSWLEKRLDSCAKVNNMVSKSAKICLPRRPMS